MSSDLEAVQHENNEESPRQAELLRRLQALEALQSRISQSQQDKRALSLDRITSDKRQKTQPNDNTEAEDETSEDQMQEISLDSSDEDEPDLEVLAKEEGEFSDDSVDMGDKLYPSDSDDSFEVLDEDSTDGDESNEEMSSEKEKAKKNPKSKKRRKDQNSPSEEAIAACSLWTILKDYARHVMSQEDVMKVPR